MPITRRDFIKIAGAGAGALVAASTLDRLWRAEALIKSGRSVSRTTGASRQAVPSFCLQCPARCGILGYIEEGYLVKIEGNPRDPNSRGGLCAKGLAGLNHLYNPDRLLFPVKRAGARGEGKWRRITWDEALEEVTAHLKAIQDSGRPDELAFISGLLEGTGGLVGRFTRAFGTPTTMDEMALYQANKETAQRLTWGAETEVPDLARTRFILNFGANPYESHPLFIPLAQRLVEAQLKGARLVTLDPRLSNTAARSDQWLPIKPGTDAAVALALAHVILRQGLADSRFLREWTNYPEDSLARHLEQYTPEAAAAISGLAAADIEGLAVELATTHPACIISGDGVSQHRNGTLNERAIALLAAVTGNVDVPGGNCLPRRYDLDGPAPRPPAPRGSAPGPANLFPLIARGELRVGLLVSALANPVYSGPQTAQTQSVLASERLIPYSVVADSYLSESAALADLVLPAATYLESWDVASPPALEQVPFVTLMQPTVGPLGESRPIADVCLELGQRLGLGRYLDFASAEDYVRTTVAGVPGLAQAGGLDHLKESGVWFDPNATPSYRSYEARGFATPSGKFQVHLPDTEVALPEYRPSPQAGNGELPLLTFQFNVHTYGRTAHCQWLSEIAHVNPVWVNPETARELGIEKGDGVRLTTATGSILAQAWVTQAIRPGVLAMGTCGGRWGGGKIAQAQRFKSPDPNTELLWWEAHGNGAHPHRIIPVAPDPVGGGQGWKDTLVKVEKA